MKKTAFSKKDALLEHLLQGHPITVLESMILFGIPSLNRELAGFKKQGWLIERKKIPFARCIARINNFAHLTPPKNLNTQDLEISEWWISR
ncbi:MAG TPA: hypothetical protein DCX14_04930 [Flavobacteriales bacterium]|jgi:hypothetical protein|nr:hypothetical protein [Flavobacteriales bacterium]